MELAERTDVATSSYEEPATKFGLTGAELLYMQGIAEPAAPSVINTNSKFLNNPYYRDVYAQIALRRDGPDLPSTYIIPMACKAIGEVTDYAEFARLIEEEKIKKPEFAEWLSARQSTAFTPANTAHHAPGTLGHAVHEFLGLGYEIDKMQLAGVEVTNDVDYISKRRANIHDLEHLVTGFGPNTCGELAIVYTAISSIANYFSPQLAHHMSAALVFLGTAAIQQKSLHYPAVFPTVLEAVQRGIEMGKALKRPLLMEPWEDMLDWQLEDISKHLGIARGPGAAWDWTTDATVG